MNKNLTFRLVLLLALIGFGVYLFIHFDLFLFFKDKDKIINFIKSSRYDVPVFIVLQIVQVVIAAIPGKSAASLAVICTGLCGDPLFYHRSDAWLLAGLYAGTLFRRTASGKSR